MFPWKTPSVWHLSFSVVRLVTVYFNGVFTLSCPPTICLPVANRAVELWFTCAQCIPRVCVRTRVTLSNVTQTWDACLMLLTYKNCLFETFLQFMPLHLILGGCISSVWLRRVLAINRSVFVLCFCSLYSTSRKNILDSLVNDGAILRCTKKKKNNLLVHVKMQNLHEQNYICVQHWSMQMSNLVLPLITLMGVG